MKVSPILALLVGIVALSLPACDHIHAEGPGHDGHQKIVATSAKAMDVILTQPYVCQIHARRHIEIRALEEGYLEEITVKEGSAVKKDQVMFTVKPILYEARYKAEKAEYERTKIEFEQTQKLANGSQPVVSQTEVLLFEAKQNTAWAKMKQAEAELNFTKVKAPFDGIMDKLRQMQGSLVKKEEVLTTLSDNTVMWVYFNVPEAQYLDYVSGLGQEDVNRRIELQLANGSKFKHTGTIAAIEGKFNNETGNIQFRADFDNEFVRVNGQTVPKLRHGQTGTILIHRTAKDAVVIPQRATFEILDQRYVWVVGEDHVAHQRPITIGHELEDIYVIKDGLGLKDKFILEGVRQVHEGMKVEYEFEKPQDALTHQKYHAE
jgi:membrane fusion protein, multidrug efflux system